MDSIKQYLEEIGKYSLLTAEEEKELAIKISQGDTLAKEKFINSNLRLVVNISKTYLNNGVDFTDLIQEGNIALIKAVETFDVTKKTKFSTFATILINHALIRTLSENGKSIRFPEETWRKIIKYKNTKDILLSELHREPAIKETADKLNISLNKAIELEKLSQETMRLNTLIGEHKEDELGAFVLVENETPETQTIKENTQKLVRELLLNSDLTEKEKYVLLCRYGFKNGEKITQGEIGKVLKLTRERIRQIETSAIKKIRIAKATEKYTIFMDHPETAFENLQRLKKLPKNKK